MAIISRLRRDNLFPERDLSSNLIRPEKNALVTERLILQLTGYDAYCRLTNTLQSLLADSDPDIDLIMFLHPLSSADSILCVAMVIKTTEMS